MTIHQTQEAKGCVITPMPARSGGPAVFTVAFKVPAGLAAGDIIEMCDLPESTTIADATLICDDLDSNGAPLLALDVGLMSGEPGSTDAGRTCGNELFAADQVGRTGGVSRMSKAAGFTLAKSTGKRSIGVKVATGAATLVPGGYIRLQLAIVQ